MRRFQLLKTNCKICVLNIMLVSSIVFGCSGGGHDDESAPLSDAGTNADSSPKENHSGFTLQLAEGLTWKYFWTSESESFSSSSSSTENDFGFFTIKLGRPETIDGKEAFPIHVSGKTSDGTIDFAPEWTHITIDENVLFGTKDGRTLERIFGRSSEKWFGGGFFVSIPKEVTCSASETTFKGVYNEIAAVTISRSMKDGGCTYFPSIGQNICDDSSLKLNEKEYYHYSIGPIGYEFTQSSSYSGGGFSSYHNFQRTLELIDTNLPLPADITFNSPPWREVTPLSAPRSSHACAVLDGKIYVIGGYDSDQNELSSVEIYDPIQDSWQSGDPLPEPLGNIKAEVSSGKIYVVSRIGEKMLIYDSKAGQWTYGPPPPLPLNKWSTDSTIMPTGELMVISTEMVDPGINVYIYGDTTKQWYYGIPIGSYSLRDPSIESIGYNVYVIGGFNYSRKERVGSVLKYEASLGKWYTTTGSMHHSRENTVSVRLNDEIVTLGGAGYGTAYRYVEAYNESSNSWRDLPQMFTPRTDFDAAVLDGKIYIVGGRVSTVISAEVLSSVHVYTP